MIDFRLTNCFSVAVQFSAASAVEFANSCDAALREIRRRGVSAPELHVRCANGDWISPTYRMGSSAIDSDGRRLVPNTPVHLKAKAEPWLYSLAVEGKRHGDRFAGQLEALKAFATAPCQRREQPPKP